MKLFLLLTIVGAFFSESSFATDLKVATCWKGYKQTEQNQNLGICRKQKAEDQKCSTNIWEHKQAAYDVCLMESPTPLKIVSIFKGWNQVEQNTNLKLCRQQEEVNTLCVSNLYIHKQAAYDVALMTPSTTPSPAIAIAVVPAKTPAVVVNASSSGAKYLSNGDNCYPADLSGRTFGSIVDDSFCSVGYRSNGYNCYHIDANGKQYGSIVDDSKCHVNYISNGYNCYNQGIIGEIYGSIVSDSLCHASYLSDNYNCYNVDRGGRLYGSIVSDSKCHAGYRSNGYNCYHIDRKGKIYGSIVADSLCQ